MSAPYEAGGPPSAAPGGKTSLGLESNLGAMLCYVANFLCCLGVILSVVFLITEKENRFVKFHALQSLFLWGVCVILMLAVQIISMILDVVSPFISFFVYWGLLFILMLIFVILWILAGIKAYGGQSYKLPGVGDIAWGIVNK